MLRPTVWLRVAQVTAWIVVALLALPMVLFGLAVLAAVSSPASDPHGYTLIFGVIFLVVLALPMLLALAAAIQMSRRSRAAVPLSVLVGVLLVAMGAWVISDVLSRAQPLLTTLPIMGAAMLIFGLAAAGSALAASSAGRERSVALTGTTIDHRLDPTGSRTQ